MKNWAAAQRHYRPGADPSDRFVACPCGCVLKVPRLDKLVEANEASANSELACQELACQELACQCADCLSVGGVPLLRNMVVLSSLQATTYLYAPNQDGEGIRWQ